MKKYYISIALCAIAFTGIFAQEEEDLLSELESETEEEEEEVVFNYPAFKAMKIGNLQSTKLADKGDLYMYVSHRFGSIKNGVSTFFGLDDATTKIQMAYGLFDGLQVSLSRESFRKTYAGALKLRLAQQTSDFPLNIVAYSTANINSQLTKEQYPLLEFADRLSYASQLLISKRFSNRFSFEIAPTYIRQNLEFTDGHDHHQFALGLGYRLKLNKRISLNTDYAYNFMRDESSIYKNPLTVGIDIETGGHVFQLLFTNAQSSNEPGFLSNAGGDWSKGDIFFGFNVVRVF